MSRRRETSLDVDREICLLVERGARSASQILDHLKERRFFNGPEVGDKTIRRRMQECRLLDDSSPWSPFDGDPEDTRRIIPVFQWAFGETYGRVWLSRAVAGWVARVCGVANPPPAWAWSFAKAYQWATQRQEDTRCLDLALMQRVWELTDSASPEVFLDNAARLERLRQACQLASPTTWKRQWDDLMGFWQWSAQSNMLPPWADEEEPLQTVVD